MVRRPHGVGPPHRSERVPNRDMGHRRERSAIMCAYPTPRMRTVLPAEE
ncbi:hypothetical protein B005_3073 [Nocardiopsis alba ATCC BAA-2165]|uniref:Uncharacterized protein n=1 Tax=Nocardiopsis alba (strain ATCC BAA-2165 / BE74) TaxID=1205910 RepID=J7LFS6_NOCAA|nr:hypothetical protein B005_3073 [Nocardiopsis alba ATCC BAA-2165]